MRNYLPWIAVLIWSCDYATSSDVDDLENEVVTLRGTITGLATEIDSLERELASVPGDLATAQQTGTENSADLDRLEGDVDRLESTVGQVQADVAAAQIGIETNSTEIDSLERELASVPGDLATAQQTGTENSADLDRLEGDVDRLESTVGQVQADVAAAQTDIETLNGTPTEVQPLAQGETELQIRSPVAAVRIPDFSSIFDAEVDADFKNTATFTGEIENLGDADAQNVIVEFRARNEEGAALSDVSVTVGTVRRGESRLFTTTFRDVGADKSDATYVTQADYTITYSDGDSVRLGGTGTIVVL